MSKLRPYEAVTARIVEMLEAGTRPWAQGWTATAGGGRPLRSTGQPYRGANTLNLWAAAMSRGFASPYWMTYKTAVALGGQVKKGAKSECAFYVGASLREVTKKDGTTDEARIPFLKSYCVFNADEIDGLAPRFYARAEVVPLIAGERDVEADTFIANTGARIDHGGGRAFYMPSQDRIQLPPFETFENPARYYGTALHELAHWTGHDSRIDRLKGKFFGSPEYAFEELVAELSAAFLSADLGISPEPREDHAAYIGSWIKVLKSDSRAIFTAAGCAEKACGFLHAFQPEEAEEDEDQAATPEPAPEPMAEAA